MAAGALTQPGVLRTEGARLLFGQLGIDVSAYRPARPAITALREAASAIGVLVVDVQNTAFPSLMSDSPAQSRFNVRTHAAARGNRQPLRSSGIRSVVVAGCTTEGCVEFMERNAMFNDYYVAFAEDCTACDDPAQHDAMLLMRHRFDLATAEQIARGWANAQRPRDVTSREEAVLG